MENQEMGLEKTCGLSQEIGTVDRGTPKPILLSVIFAALSLMLSAIFWLGWYKFLPIIPDDQIGVLLSFLNFPCVMLALIYIIIGLCAKERRWFVLLLTGLMLVPGLLVIGFWTIIFLGTM